MRWIASLVAEVHRILMRGGLFMYPKDTKDPGKPGRLRLLYEANPMAMLIEQAGGAASTGRGRIVEVAPTSLHQRVPVILGSKNEVARLERYHAEFDRGDVAFSSPLFNERSLFGAATLSPADGGSAMSTKHPVVAITGSSGAGTTTVTRTFEHIFRRENIRAAIVEGDSFHRYDRKEMKAKMAEATAAGNQHFSHFGPEANLLAGARGDVPRLRRDGHRQGAQVPARRRGGEALRPGARHLHALERHRARHRPPVLRGPARRRGDRHGQRRRLRRPADRRRADHQPRVDPEAAPRPDAARLLAGGRGRHHPAADARLHQLHLPAVLAHAHQLPAGADGRHVEPVHRQGHPDRSTRAWS